MKCNKCNADAIEGQTMCDRHRVHYNAIKMKWKNKQLARGRCIQCGKVKEQGRTNYNRCAMCAGRHKELGYKSRYKKKLSGECLNCKTPTTGGTQFCAKHLKKHIALTRQHKIDLKAAGKCAQCGEPIDELSAMVGGSACIACLDTRQGE